MTCAGMAGTLDFNPYEAPPQELKGAFKSWKGPLTPERDQILNISAENMPRMDSIPHHRLDEIFTKFLQHMEDAHPDITEREPVALENSGSIYSSQNVPGRESSLN
jgi:alkylated DNA repair protein alkB family protein 1